MQYVKNIKGDILVLGCGNTLFGDDGFGVCVAEHLRKETSVPPHVSVIDARTSVRGILFDVMLADPKPDRIVVVDAIDAGRRPGEVFRIGIDDLPLNKIDDFSLHQMPTSNLLRELRDCCNVDVVIIAAQVEKIPEEVCPGLSETLANSIIPAACEVLAACGYQEGSRDIPTGRADHGLQG